MTWMTVGVEKSINVSSLVIVDVRRQRLCRVCLTFHSINGAVDYFDIALIRLTSQLHNVLHM